MNSDSILAYVNRFVQLTTEEKEFFESVLIPRPYKQGELLVQSGDHARYMLYVNEGYLMTYYTDKDGADHVVQFAAAGWWCNDIYSISGLHTTRFSTKGLSDGEVLLLPRTAHLQLLEKYN